MKYTVLVVDDHQLFREGLSLLINTWDDFEVVGEASNGQQAIEAAHVLMPDMILMDIAMPVLDGLEATRIISQEIPSTHIVMLTRLEEEESLLTAIKNGARGYIVKDIPSSGLHKKLLGVMHGEMAFSGMMVSKIINEFSKSKPGSEMIQDDGLEQLTNREKEILEMIVQGLSNAEIAEKMMLSESTIKKYLHNIMDKMQLNNRIQVAIYAVKKGLIKI